MKGEKMNLILYIFGGLLLLWIVLMLLTNILERRATPAVLQKAAETKELVMLFPLGIEGVVASCEEDHILFKQVLLLGPMAPIRILRKDIRRAVFYNS